MARRLKAFTTTAGFFDLAVAAPSMKAALEAWGAGSNLFNQGFARESHDVDVVTATMANPGVVLRRPVGTKRAFTENAEVSDAFVDGTRRPAQPRAEPKGKAASSKADYSKASHRAALAYEREAAKRERERRKEEATLQRERERRKRAIAVAEAALETAKEAHIRTKMEIDKAQSALDRRSNSEQTRWEAEREKLQVAVREARSPRHLKVVP